MQRNEEIVLAPRFLKQLAHFFGTKKTENPKATTSESFLENIDFFETSPAKEFPGESRAIFVSCVGHPKTSLKPNQMQVVLDSLTAYGKKPRIYLEETNQQTKDDWFRDNDANLVKLYPDAEERAKNVDSIFKLRETQEWKTLREMLLYFLMPEGESKVKKKEELSKLLSEEEKSSFFKEGKKDVLEAFRFDLLNTLNRDAKGYAVPRTKENEDLDANILSSKNHFIDVAVDIFCFMRPKNFKGTPYRTAVIHTHALPSFIKKATEKLAERFSRQYDSIADFEVKFPEAKQCVQQDGVFKDKDNDNQPHAQNITTSVMKEELVQPASTIVHTLLPLPSSTISVASPSSSPVTFKPKKVSPPNTIKMEESSFYAKVLADTVLKFGPSTAEQLVLSLTQVAAERASQKRPTTISTSMHSIFTTPTQGAPIMNQNQNPGNTQASPPVSPLLKALQGSTTLKA